MREKITKLYERKNKHKRRINTDHAEGARKEAGYRDAAERENVEYSNKPMPLNFNTYISV